MNEHAEADARLGGQIRLDLAHLRRTFCTRLGDLGVLPRVIEVAVNHRAA
jgi:hypothetical protein